MMTRSVASAVAVSVLCLIGAQAAVAHRGDRLLLIPELTDADLLAVDVRDGWIDEWLQLLGEPVVTDADFNHYGGTAERTMHFRMWLAWHGASGRIYVAVQSVDDAFRDDFHRDLVLGTMILGHDTYVGIGVDGDHSGDDRYLWRSPEEQHRGAQEYHVIGVSHGLPPIELWSYGGDDPYAIRPLYSDAGGGSVSEQPTISVTEAYVTVFDGMDLEFPNDSLPSDLRAGRIIGLALKVTDTDAAWGMRLPDAYSLPDRWGSYLLFAPRPEGRDGYGIDAIRGSSSFFADALLLPARSAEGADSDRVLVDSWARIKASFSQDRSGKPQP